MPLLRFIAWMSVAGLMALAGNVACGQDYPNKPIRILTAPAGAGTDFVARLIAQGLTGSLGQQVIVDNRPGLIAAETVAQATPDGYILLAYSDQLWLAPFMEDKVPYNPVKDFAPITLAGNSPNILVVHPTLPASSVMELITMAKAKPGELNYASAPSGSALHIAAELFKVMTGVNIVRVAYKGAAPALNALIGGEVQLAFAPAGSASAHVKSGRLRALGVTSAERSALFPELPTVAATVPGYKSGIIYAILTPAGTPTTINNRLNQEIVRVLNRADMKEKFLNSGVETVGSSPQQLATTMKTEMAIMGKMIKDAGIHGE